MSLIPNDLITLETELVTLMQAQILETPPSFNADSDLYETGLDSMAIMQLLIVLEENYGVTISDAELSTDNFRTVRSLARLLQTRRNPA